MKIISKIKIHPLSYLIALIFFLMGLFRNYIIIMNIILIHEIGHVFASLFLKWKIEKIIILPFGCLLKYNEYLNKPIIEEFIIAIMGIIFQILFTFKCCVLYNTIIIIFNLLPIYPLDGYKILNLLLNKIINFRLSYLISIYISYLFLYLSIIYIIINRDIIYLMVIIPLIIGLNKEYRNRYNIINKFYLERYLYKFNFNKIKIINNLKKMKRDYMHFIKCNHKCIYEKEYLKKLFDKKV